MVKELVKNFEWFCKIIEGTFEHKLCPECIRIDMKISLEFLEKEEGLEHLTIKIESETGDVNEFTIKNIKRIEVKRLSENDENGVLRYYTFAILTDKGNIYIKKDIVEKKIIFQFEEKDIKIVSTVLL